MKVYTIPFSLIHYLLHYPFTALMVIHIIILKRLGFDQTVRGIPALWGKFLFLSLGRRIEVSGLENLRSERSRVVILNHASLFDIPAILTVLPDGAFIGRSKLLSIPLFGAALKTLGYIPIDPLRISQSMEALEEGVSEASGGRSIIMFPEGTRTLTGDINPFRRGFIRILRKSGADLVPVTLNGFYTLKPKYNRLIDPTEALSIVIHPPLTSEELDSMDDREIMEKARETIQSAYNYKKELS